MNRPADFEARRRALDPGRSFIVQAPAGSGKTEVLTQRFLRLLATVERPERVLAITFTRKATQEMRTRITARLAQARAGARPEHEHDRQAVKLAGEVLERDRERGWNLLRNPGRLRINTIDGLCAQLLARDPIEGPRWYGVKILENPEPLYRKAVARLFADVDELAESRVDDAKSAQDALVRLLVHLGGDSRRLERLLREMLRQRSLWKRHLDASPEMLAGLLEDRQARALGDFRSALGETELDEADAILRRLGLEADQASGADGPLRKAYRFADRLTRADGKPWAPSSLPARVFAGIEPSQLPLVERFGEIYGHWHDSDSAYEALERMACWPPLDVVPQAVEWPGSLLDDARSVLSLALTELNSLMGETGHADFTAIADGALASLGGDESPGETLLAEDARIDHILMDEFQDSSHAQFRLLSRLTEGWQAGDGRSLFLVGDPMQSIYRFREANVGFFNDVVHLGRLGQVAIVPLSLTSNFRSRGELVDWFNRTFSRIFPTREERESGAVAYTPVSAELPTGGKVCLHAIAAGDPLADEAGKMAALIEAAREDLGDPTIAILVRSREQVPDIASGLACHGIEFEAVEIDRLAGRGVVQDLLILTRALAHPLDRVAWIALLRAPWCGLELADLHRVVGEDPREEVRQSVEAAIREERLDAVALKRLRRLSRVMARAQDRAASHGLADRVQMCWIQLGGPLCCADAAALANAESFLELLEELEHGGRQELTERLEEALENRFAASRSAKVQILTIHKAKGLEFDVVIVPGLERPTRGSTDSLITLQEFSGGVLMAPLTPKSMAEVSLYRHLNRVDAERDRLESQRVLYVACTRARRRLHLIATATSTARGHVSIRANTFLKLLEEPFLPHLERVLERAMAQTQTEERPEEIPPAVPLRRLKGPLPEVHAVERRGAGAAGLRDLPRREAVAMGTVLHRWLELIHDHPEEAWDAARIERSGAPIRDSLARAGAPADRLDALQARCTALLCEALADQDLMAAIGPNKNIESWSELALYRREGTGFSRHVIDLLWRDEAGALHVIDYKTGQAAKDGLENGAWQAQLARYRELLEALGAGPVSEARVRVLAGDERREENA